MLIMPPSDLVVLNRAIISWFGFYLLDHPLCRSPYGIAIKLSE